MALLVQHIFDGRKRVRDVNGLTVNAADHVVVGNTGAERVPDDASGGFVKRTDTPNYDGTIKTLIPYISFNSLYGLDLGESCSG